MAPDSTHVLLVDHCGFFLYSTETSKIDCHAYYVGASITTDVRCL